MEILDKKEAQRFYSTVKAFEGSVESLTLEFPFGATVSHVNGGVLTTLNGTSQYFETLAAFAKFYRLENKS